ncbi:MAG: DNA cytosine methyltransferase [Planctomycetales bacterium]|nr:DNA cytosine methyltransferase [Planctomycetales bacterium]
MSRRLRVLELFCGIGGCAAALGDSAEVVAAIDIDRTALDVYAANFAHATQARTIESIPARELAAFDADLWWMSPPCQPFTRRGNQRDLADSRSQAFLNLVDCFRTVRPTFLALENVPPFAESDAADLLRNTLRQLGYHWLEGTLCPTQLGIANRRQRFYLLASRDQPFPQLTFRPVSCNAWVRRVADVLEPLEETLPGLVLSRETVGQYQVAMHTVDANDTNAVMACFTSAYGRSPVRSGSYLRTGSEVRRFSPTEIAAMLGFSTDFQFPNSLSLRRQWSLVGNSLSVDVVRYVLSHLAVADSLTT